eukprot:12348725-Alexandrium_andersonii.AAC.1
MRLPCAPPARPRAASAAATRPSRKLPSPPGCCAAGSSSTSSRRPAARKPPASRPAERASCKPGRAGPVSYTHLTLPTICSV